MLPLKKTGIMKIFFVIMFLPLLFLINSEACAQAYEENIPFYVDEGVVNALIGSLRLGKPDTFFCFLTANAETQTTYFWSPNSLIYRISDSAIFISPTNAERLLGSIPVTTTGRQLKFKPPLIPSEGCDILIVYTHQKSGIILSDSDCLQQIFSGSKQQSELIRNLKRQLLKIQKWQYYSDYLRQWD